MTARVPLSPAIRALCATYFGYGTKAKQFRDSCDYCPARQPCLEWGRAPAVSIEQLDEARVAFNAAVERLQPTGEQP